MLYIYIQYMHVFVYTDTDIYLCMYVCTYSLLTFLQAKGLYMQHMFISGSSQVQDDSASSDGSGCESTDEGPKGNAGIEKNSSKNAGKTAAKSKGSTVEVAKAPKSSKTSKTEKKKDQEPDKE